MIRTLLYSLLSIILCSFSPCCFAEEDYKKTKVKKVLQYRNVVFWNKTDIPVRVRVFYRNGFSVCESKKNADVLLAPGGRFVFEYDKTLPVWNKYVRVGGSKLNKIQAGQIWDISTLLVKRVSNAE